jgi:hypothetical protein
MGHLTHLLPAHQRAHALRNPTSAQDTQGSHHLLLFCVALHPPALLYAHPPPALSCVAAGFLLPGAPSTPPHLLHARSQAAEAGSGAAGLAPPRRRRFSLRVFCRRHRCLTLDFKARRHLNLPVRSTA